jgi:hypothetical protein
VTVACLLHYLYIDESGDEGDITPADLLLGKRKVFTVGGIIVDAHNRELFENNWRDVIDTYFSGIELPPNFKLQYHQLRKEKDRKFPFDRLSDSERYDIIERMYNAIRSIDCHLISVSLNIPAHYKQYSKPISPRAYTLLLLMERFQYFLEDYGSKGEASYERYTKGMQEKVEDAQIQLLSFDNFPKPTDFKYAPRKIKSGDPTKEHMLQFSDFFVYAPYIRHTYNHHRTDKWNSVAHKYYNLNYRHWYKRGYIEINEKPIP